jgi:hypothetical protein
MWTIEERGNVEADHVCGRARKMALGDGLMWLERANEWRARCEELEEKYVVVPERLVNEIKLPVGVHVLYRRWNRGSYLLTCSGGCVGMIR